MIIRASIVPDGDHRPRTQTIAPLAGIAPPVRLWRRTSRGYRALADRAIATPPPPTRFGSLPHRHGTDPVSIAPMATAAAGPRNEPPQAPPAASASARRQAAAPAAGGAPPQR